MRPKDLQEMRRRREEVTWIHECGYDPVYVDGRKMWVKCHWGSVHTHAGALKDIERDRSAA